MYEVTLSLIGTYVVINTMFNPAPKVIEMSSSQKSTFQDHVRKSQFEEAARMAENFRVPTDLQEEFGRLLAQSQIAEFRTLLKSGKISQDKVGPDQGGEIAGRVGSIAELSFASHFFKALDPASRPEEGIFILSLNTPQLDSRVLQSALRYHLN